MENFRLIVVPTIANLKPSESRRSIESKMGGSLRYHVHTRLWWGYAEAWQPTKIPLIAWLFIASAFSVADRIKVVGQDCATLGGYAKRENLGLEFPLLG
jgi:hypothetical protein